MSYNAGDFQQRVDSAKQCYPYPCSDLVVGIYRLAEGRNCKEFSNAQRVEHAFLCDTLVGYIDCLLMRGMPEFMDIYGCDLDRGFSVVHCGLFDRELRKLVWNWLIQLLDCIKDIPYYRISVRVWLLESLFAPPVDMSDDDVFFVISRLYALAGKVEYSWVVRESYEVLGVDLLRQHVAEFKREWQKRASDMVCRDFYHLDSIVSMLEKS